MWGILLEELTITCKPVNRGVKDCVYLEGLVCTDPDCYKCNICAFCGGADSCSVCAVEAMDEEESWFTEWDPRCLEFRLLDC